MVKTTEKFTLSNYNAIIWMHLPKRIMPIAVSQQITLISNLHIVEHCI